MKSGRTTVRYRGRVQGVGFRFTAARLAAKFDVTGFVMNQPDGSVLLEAEGDTEERQGLINAIRLSRLGSEIDSEERCEGPALRNTDSFEIRYW